MSLEQLKERVTKLESKDDGDIKLFFASWAVTVDPTTGDKRTMRCLCAGGPPIVRADEETEDAFIKRARTECIERYRTAGRKGLQAAWLDEVELQL